MSWRRNKGKSRNRFVAAFLSRAAEVDSADVDIVLTPVVATTVDSATVTALIDSNYITNRITQTRVLDSATVISLIASNSTPSGVDSATVLSLIANNSTPAGIDSATVLSLIDSNYVSVRVTSSGGGGSGGGTTKLTYAYDGELATYNGVKRTYITENGTISKADIFVKTAPIGAPITAVLNKNGSSIATISLASGNTSSINNTINQSVLKGDYLTMDVTSVGLTPAGEDMVINLIFG